MNRYMSEKAVSDDLEALNLKYFLARRQPWWRLVSLGHTLKGMTNIFSLATPLFVIILILFDTTDYRCYMVIVRYRSVCVQRK